MKKLFYIVLVIVLLMVISSFVKKNLQEKATVQETAVVVDVVEDCDCNVIRECDPEDKECIARLKECGCEESDDAPVEDVEEENPEMTQDEGETIINE